MAVFQQENGSLVNIMYGLEDMQCYRTNKLSQINVSF